MRNKTGVKILRGTSPSRTAIAVAFALFAAVWLLSANSLSNGFTYDDTGLIVDNKFFKSETPLPTVFSTNYRSGCGRPDDGLYRPLVMLSFLKNGGSADPLPFHLFNVTLNAANTVLFFLLLLAMSRSIAISAVAAALFGFHPVHTEAVANIAGRPELMYVFFALAAWGLLEWRRETKWASAAAGLLLFLGLLSKESAVMLPFLVIANDFAQKRPLLTKSALWRYLPMFCAVVAFLAIREAVLWDLPGSFFGNYPGLDVQKIDNPVANAAFITRTATAFAVLAKYVVILFFPLRLSADYSYNAIPAVSSLMNPAALFGLALFCGIIAAGIIAYRRGNSPGALAAALFLLPYLPVSNLLFPIGTIMGERLMYLPSAGFALGAAIFATPALKRRNVWAVAAFSLILVLFATRTIDRNRDWKNNLTLFSVNVKLFPNSAKTLSILGSETRGEESLRYYRRAVEILPDDGDILRGYATRLLENGWIGTAEQYFARTVALAPNDASAHHDYALVLKKERKLSEAEREIRRAISLVPSAALPYEELSSICLFQGKYAEALDALRKATVCGGNPEVITRNTMSAQFLSGNVAGAYRTLQDAASRGIPVDPKLAGMVAAAAGAGRPPVRK